MPITKVKFSTKEELFDKAYERLKEYESEFTSGEVRTKIEELKNSLTSLYRGEDVIKAYLCGSRKIGIATGRSDVDIFLDIGGTFGGAKYKDYEWQMEQVRTFARRMRRRSGEFDEVVAVEARVPILQFKHLETDFKCDVSFRSGLTHQKSELLNFYVNLDRRVKFVVAGVKYWMEKHKLADPNKFTSYAQVWLALFFLMQRGVIPSVQELRELTHPQVYMVEGWNCAVPKSKDENVKLKMVGISYKSSEELLEDFFVFYSHNIDNGTIEQSVLRPRYGSVRKSKTFKRVLKENCVKRGEISKLKIFYRDFLSAFKIQDPFDMLQNLTKDMTSSKECQRFANLCRQTAELPHGFDDVSDEFDDVSHESDDGSDDEFDDESNEFYDGSDEFNDGYHDEPDEFNDESDEFNDESDDESNDGSDDGAHEFNDESDEFNDGYDDESNEFYDGSDNGSDEFNDGCDDEPDEFNDESDEFNDESDEFNDESDEFNYESNDGSDDEFNDESNDGSDDGSHEFNDGSDDEFDDESEDESVDRSDNGSDDESNDGSDESDDGSNEFDDDSDE